MSTSNDIQIGGQHYAGAYQHWDFVAECLGNDYLLGCATKYIWRHAKKNGLEDLRKADHYLQKAAESPLRHGVVKLPADAVAQLYRTVARRECELIRQTALAWTAEDFQQARKLLKDLMLLRYGTEIRRAQAEDDGPRYEKD